MQKLISVLFAAAFGLLAACAPGQSASSPTYDSAQASGYGFGQVHYEAVDANGAFTEHRELNDPMAKNYEPGVWRASRKSTVSTESTAGVAGNRVNIVFVGDGYTSSQLGDYASDATKIQAQFLKEAPFKSYASYFSFHRVNVVSKDSGVSKAIGQETKNTALGMSYDCDGVERLLCIDLNKTMAEAQNAPAVDAVFAMANSATYGGAGYWSPPVSTFAAKNMGSVELALHEFGHSFGRLTDEYNTPGSTTDGCEDRTNTADVNAANMKATRSKWYRWLGTQGVDAYQGSCYSMSYYRPHLNSKMRTLNNPYGAVNVEQLILRIYSRVKPIDSASPTTTTYAADSGTLTIKPMKPSDHSLAVTWKVDGQTESSLKGKTQVALSSLNLTSGTHTVSVTVADLTALVKDEAARAASMTQTLTYAVKR